MAALELGADWLLELLPKLLAALGIGGIDIPLNKVHTDHFITLITHHGAECVAHLDNITLGVEDVYPVAGITQQRKVFFVLIFECLFSQLTVGYVTETPNPTKHFIINILWME